MATRLLSSSHCHFILRTHGLRFSSVFFHRIFSQSTSESIKSLAATAESTRNWLNVRDGIFGPEDSRLPLPGNIGHSKILDPNGEEKIDYLDNLLLFHDNALEIFESNEETKVINVMEESPTLEQFPLEVRIQKCPRLLKKDFQELFPSADLKAKELSVVTFCHKTKNDMSSWSESVEEEREAHIKQFVDSANTWCNALQQEGYWADFVDPTSGRPFIGSYTNFTFFETDERYRHLGFIIDDLGCCKVITHRIWGSNIFVGALFTDAPVSSEVLEDLCKKDENTPAS